MNESPTTHRGSGGPPSAEEKMKTPRTTSIGLVLCAAGFLLAGCAINVVDDPGISSANRALRPPVSPSPVEQNRSEPAPLTENTLAPNPSSPVAAETNRTGVVYMPAPPPPKAESVPAWPGFGYVWVPGAWNWRKGDWIWVEAVGRCRPVRGQHGCRGDGGFKMAKACGLPGHGR